MAIYQLHEKCASDGDRRYVDIYNGEKPDFAKSGDAVIDLPEAEAVMLVWRMNPDLLPKWASLKYAEAIRNERKRAETTYHAAIVANAFLPFAPTQPA
jgi:hypothetical protein